DKARAIGQLEAVVPVRRVAALCGVSPGNISKLRTKFRETGEVKDRPRRGRPRKTTPPEDRFLTLASLRNRRLSSRDLQARFAQQDHRQISDQTVRNRLHMAGLRAYKAARKPAMTALHRQARLRWPGPHPQCGTISGRGYVPRLLPRHQGFAVQKAPVSRSSPPVRSSAVLRRPRNIEDSRVSGNHPDIMGNTGAATIIRDKTPTSPGVHKVVLSFGLNDNRDKRNPTLLENYLKKLLNASRDTFPNAEIHLPIINISAYPTPNHIVNIRILNQLILHTHQSLPKLRRSAYATLEDHVHWSPDTANSMWEHWSSFLGLGNPSLTLHP
ncbi:Transposable element Tcb1 transposase, partial [Dissostichus eleginoides]